MKVWVAKTDAGKWLFDTNGPGGAWTEIEVGEATYASWQHARDANQRAQWEIEDMWRSRETE